ncbi:phosphoglycerate mutase [Skermanella stibiiresistens SB22]|uniref:Phosphoglycerate mutase n=1 Tax=Skermanella stibiiresistens SB22 TaxID=1385369 RepID=W9H7A1_9PROT|nr:histidine phosphatase family protein [Skermanella stibiiresistens]EWY40587.1 phosphoglycerate mutase [Skermanella stibiiresistens SB22]
MILIRHGQSEFNAAFAIERVDPGLVDPGLTDLGRTQALAAATELSERGLRRLIASPYTRALQTASIIAEILELPIEVQPILGEHAFFMCDIGSPRSELEKRWPHLEFDHVPEIWWPEREDSEDGVTMRAAEFRAIAAGMDDAAHVGVVSHWGFIRAMTGQEVTNCALVEFNPKSDPAPDFAKIKP